MDADRLSPLPDRPCPPESLTERILAWVRWYGAARLLAGAATIVVVALASWWLFRAGPPPAEAGLPMATRQPSAPTGGSAPTTTPKPSVLVVHVSGEVARPGVVSLPAGARVIDAVAAAGGPTASAEIERINLAALLVDGAKVHIPAPGESAPAVAGAQPAGQPAGPLDLNAATAEQLDQLPGIGPSTAAAIIAYREAHGPFGSVDALAEVRGIGPAKLDSLRSLLTV